MCMFSSKNLLKFLGPSDFENKCHNRVEDVNIYPKIGDPGFIKSDIRIKVDYRTGSVEISSEENLANGETSKTISIPYTNK
jgi:hypothetical protein